MTISQKIEILDIIKEHCQYCPEDLGAVAQALLAVEDKLDYYMKYSLENLLQTYVIARARMEPEGLQSILDRFPVPSTDGNVQEALDESRNELLKQVRSISPTTDSVDSFAHLEKSVGNLLKSDTIAAALHEKDDKDNSTESGNENQKGQKLTESENGRMGEGENDSNKSRGDIENGAKNKKL